MRTRRINGKVYHENGTGYDNRREAELGAYAFRHWTGASVRVIEADGRFVHFIRYAEDSRMASANVGA